MNTLLGVADEVYTLLGLVIELHNLQDLKRSEGEAEYYLSLLSYSSYSLVVVVEDEGHNLLVAVIEEYMLFEMADGVDKLLELETDEMSQDIEKQMKTSWIDFVGIAAYLYPVMIVEKLID